MTTADKSALAYRTIGEVAEDLGVPQHVLRFWETRFTQLQPMKRGGNRRYYRPADVALLQRINRLLYTEGYTIKGVQKLLAEGAAAPAPAATGAAGRLPAGVSIDAVQGIRDRLAAGLAAARA